MADEFRIILTDETARAAGGGGSVAGKSIGVTELSGKIGAAVQIAQEIGSIIGDAIGGILQPIRSTLVVIGKMIGEFLRPIADMAMIALMPVLQMIRPVLQLFKTFMAPAMAAARELSQISQAQMAAGLEPEAMTTAMAGVQALLGPFIVSITSVALQLLNTMLTASVANWLKTVSDIIRAVALFIAPSAADTINATFNKLNGVIDGKANEWITSVNGAITTGTITVLDEMNLKTEEKLAEFRGIFVPNMQGIIVETPTSMFSELKTNTDTKMAEIGNSYGDGLSVLQESTDKFTNKLEAAAKRINDIRIKDAGSSNKSTTNNFSLLSGNSLIRFG
jgi:hypothetical protein